MNYSEVVANPPLCALGNKCQEISIICPKVRWEVSSCGKEDMSPMNLSHVLYAQTIFQFSDIIYIKSINICT